MWAQYIIAWLGAGLEEGESKYQDKSTKVESGGGMSVERLGGCEVVFKYKLHFSPANIRSPLPKAAVFVLARGDFSECGCHETRQRKI